LSSGIKWILAQTSSPVPVVVLILIGLISLGWGIGSGYSGTDLYIVVRFFYFLQVALVAFATSWTLFPQTAMWLTQSLNPDRKAMATVLLGRVSMIAVFTLTFLSAVIIAVSDIGIFQQLSVFFDVLIFAVGITIFGTSRFMTIGSNSQLWQEGSRGKALIDYLKEANSAGAGVPAGAVPTILATSLVALVGMFSIVIQAWVQGASGLLIPGIAGLLLMVPGLITWKRVLRALDAEFYHSHGFYNELFRNPGGRADGGREPVPFESLYWVPASLKPASWLTFRQLDRKFPMGRLLVLVFIVYWGLIKANVLDVQSMILLPGAIIVLKNLILFAIDRVPYSSLWYRREMGSERIWMGVHLVTGLRWLIPTQFFLGLTVWFVNELSNDTLVYWILFDLVVILLIAIIRAFSTSKKYASNYR
jgi:hypothetical protein